MRPVYQYDVSIHNKYILYEANTVQSLGKYKYEANINMRPVQVWGQYKYDASTIMRSVYIYKYEASTCTGPMQLWG